MVESEEGFLAQFLDATRKQHLGPAAADYDNDGWYDIFFADGKNPRLYRNNRDGTFSDATGQAGLPGEMLGINVGIFADFDNDGDKDLFLGCFTDENRLFRNNADGTFADVTKDAGLGGYFVSVAAAADYDNDGNLDIYLGSLAGTWTLAKISPPRSSIRETVRGTGSFETMAAFASPMSPPRLG